MLGLKKKMQVMRLTPEERKTATQGAGRYAMNGMLAGATAGCFAGLAVVPFAPITAPAGLLAGAMLGLAAGATAGAIGGVRRERQFVRYTSEYDMRPDQNASRITPMSGLSHRNGLYSPESFPGQGHVLGEHSDYEGASAPSSYDPGMNAPSDQAVPNDKLSQQRPPALQHSRSFTAGARSSSRSLFGFSTTSASRSTTALTRPASQHNDEEEGEQMTDRERRRATKLLEKELAREQKLAQKEEKQRQKLARKAEKERRKAERQNKGKAVMKRGGDNLPL